MQHLEHPANELTTASKNKKTEEEEETPTITK